MRKTVNSLSGGKSSSYIAANYPADYNVFALVRTNDKSCLYPDKKIRQIVSDKISQEFIGTLEQDNIIKIMLDLEQYIGREIIYQHLLMMLRVNLKMDLMLEGMLNLGWQECIGINILKILMERNKCKLVVLIVNHLILENV